MIKWYGTESKMAAFQNQKNLSSVYGILWHLTCFSGTRIQKSNVKNEKIVSTARVNQYLKADTTVAREE